MADGSGSVDGVSGFVSVGTPGIHYGLMGCGASTAAGSITFGKGGNPSGVTVHGQAVSISMSMPGTPPPVVGTATAAPGFDSAPPPVNGVSAAAGPGTLAFDGSSNGSPIGAGLTSHPGNIGQQTEGGGGIGGTFLTSIAASVIPSPPNQVSACLVTASAVALKSQVIGLVGLTASANKLTPFATAAFGAALFTQAGTVYPITGLAISLPGEGTGRAFATANPVVGVPTAIGTQITATAHAPTFNFLGLAQLTATAHAVNSDYGAQGFYATAFTIAADFTRLCLAARGILGANLTAAVGSIGGNPALQATAATAAASFGNVTKGVARGILGTSVTASASSGPQPLRPYLGLPGARVEAAAPRITPDPSGTPFGVTATATVGAVIYGWAAVPGSISITASARPLPFSTGAAIPGASIASIAKPVASGPSPSIPVPDALVALAGAPGGSEGAPLPGAAAAAISTKAIGKPAGGVSGVGASSTAGSMKAQPTGTPSMAIVTAAATGFGITTTASITAGAIVARAALIGRGDSLSITGVGATVSPGTVARTGVHGIAGIVTYAIARPLFVSESRGAVGSATIVATAHTVGPAHGDNVPQIPALPVTFTPYAPAVGRVADLNVTVTLDATITRGTSEDVYETIGFNPDGIADSAVYILTGTQVGQGDIILPIGNVARLPAEVVPVARVPSASGPIITLP